MFPEEILKSTPHRSGVYLMLDAKSKVIYVGKAKDLTKRLSSYVRHSSSEYNKTTIMLSKVVKVDTIITGTEKEALILEASLIKKHKPKYNIILRDDKNYPFISVTVAEDWPRVMMVRRKKKDGSRYFGPYSSSSAMWATLKLIASLFPLRNCKGTNLKPRPRACLNRQIGRCLAPCTGNVSSIQYMDNVKNIILLLEGKNHDLIRSLKEKMNLAATGLKFEEAALLRDQIQALEKTLEKQMISSNHRKNQDIFGYARSGTNVAIHILFVRNGLVNGSRPFVLEDPLGKDERVLEQVITQYYEKNSLIPNEIILPFPPEDPQLLKEYIEYCADHKTSLIIPKRGDKIKLLDIAHANAEQIFKEKEKKEKSWKNTSLEMIKKLHLNKSPNLIECVDISNISGKQAVGSLVSFKNGEANKSSFRHYKIRTIEGPDDYGMMREVLYRRFNRGIEENNLPDLFMVDGGKGQLNMALAVARDLGIEDEMDWIGIAKERVEGGDKLYKPGRKNPIVLADYNPILLYLMRIRDESHRYGITLHRKLRNKESLSSELDAIEGVGKNKKLLLLKQLGSLKNIRSASMEELQTVNGIGNKLANDIYNFFH
ncbi:MAG: excinuclease ABC subunit UvrC [Desulfotalea sp.]